MVPSPCTVAKSRTRFSIRLAIRGVPRAHLANSSAPSRVMGTFRMPALRTMMLASSSGLYGSSLRMMPNRSRSGPVSCPARVVAPTSVKWGRLMRMLCAAGPLPIMMSSAKSSSAG